MCKEKEILLILCGILLKESELYKTFLKAGSIEEVESLLNKKVQKSDIEKAKNNLALLKKLNGKVTSVFDDNYPKTLKNIYNAPPIIYSIGEYLPEDEEAIAVVGSRNVSEKGKILTELLVRDLKDIRITIVSGLAIGVDTIAHREALNNGLRTIAVLGSGIDVVYPAVNKTLFNSIKNNGAIFSEQPLGTKPMPYNFPKRNRVISGLSRAVVVVEAGEKSGSLITARYSAEQNRDVYTFPRTPIDKNSAGNNYLIKIGAKVITSGKDLIEEVFPQKIRQENKNEKKIMVSEEERKILNLLQEDPVNIEKLCFSLDMGPPTLANFLLNLELKGLIKELPGKFYIKIKET
ncbi:MAG: DNA-processing protein DprA [Proteobacteria bacterium]|nr:DNA-processing protein DprA [Pseudomonadota bacterium]